MTDGFPSDRRSSEKEHVRLMQTTEGLETKPFLGGASLNVDNAACDIAIFSAIVSSIPSGPGSLVLDVGAGACWLSDWLQKLKFRTCSMDLSEDMLKIGRSRLAAGSSVCAGDMAAVPLADGTADAVVCYAALHHVPNWPEALVEFRRVLRPGGVLVMQEPGRGHHKTAEAIFQMEQFGVLEQDLPSGTLARACRRAGFARVVIRPVAQLPFGRVRIMPPFPFRMQTPLLSLRQRLKLTKAEIVERLLNFLTPLHVVVAMNGRPCADSRRPEAMRARFAHVECVGSSRAGEPFRVRARIRNTGMTRWLADPRDSSLGQVRLGISPVDAAGRILNLDFARLQLPHDVEPDAEIEVSGEVASLLPPDAAGLRFDLVSEGVGWFSDKGSRPFLMKTSEIG